MMSDLTYRQLSPLAGRPSVPLAATGISSRRKGHCQGRLGAAFMETMLVFRSFSASAGAYRLAPPTARVPRDTAKVSKKVVSVVDNVLSHTHSVVLSIFTSYLVNVATFPEKRQAVSATHQAQCKT